MNESVHSRESWLKSAVRESVLYSAAAGVWRRLGRMDDVIGRALAARRPNDEGADERAREIAAQSRLVQFVDRLLSLPALAWQSSAVARKMGPVLREVQALELWQKIRLAGWMLAVGLLARVISYLLIADEPVGRVTLAVWGITAGLALLTMAWSREIAAAWVDRAKRRLPRD